MPPPVRGPGTPWTHPTTVPTGLRAFSDAADRWWPQPNGSEEPVFKRVGLAVVITGLAVLAASPAASAAKGAKLTTTLDGKKVLPLRVRWLAHPPGKASAVTDVRFFVDGKFRWIEHGAPYNFGSDDQKGHLGWLVTSWLSPGRHRFTVKARMTDGRKLSDTTVARVVQAPAPPPELTGRWRRTLTDDDLAKVDPRLVGNMPTGVWERVFDPIGVWDLDPLGTGVVQHAGIRPGTMKV